MPARLSPIIFGGHNNIRGTRTYFRHFRPSAFHPLFPVSGFRFLPVPSLEPFGPSSLTRPPPRACVARPVLPGRAPGATLARRGEPWPAGGLSLFPLDPFGGGLVAYSSAYPDPYDPWSGRQLRTGILLANRPFSWQNPTGKSGRARLQRRAGSGFGPGRAEPQFPPTSGTRPCLKGNYSEPLQPSRVFPPVQTEC